MVEMENPSTFLRNVSKRCIPIVCLLALSACGGGGGSNSTPTQPSTSDNNPPVVTPPADTTPPVVTPPADTTPPVVTPPTQALAFVYVTDRTNGSVTKCTVDSATGALMNCGMPATGFVNPTDIVINGNNAYIASFGGNTVHHCTIDANGDLSACTNAGVTGMNGPTDIAIQGTTAYIVNFGSNTISKCAIDATSGALSGCVDSGALGLNSPIGLDIRNGFAYVTNVADNSVSQCTIDGVTGNLACASNKKYNTLGLFSPYGITLNGTSAYIISQGAAGTTTVPMMQSKVTRCTVDATTGDIDPLSCTTETGFSVPDALPTDWYQTNRMVIKGNIAYLANRNINKVTQCTVNGTTGALSDCMNAASVFNAATGIVMK